MHKQIINQLIQILKENISSDDESINFNEKTKLSTILSSLDLVEFSISIEETFEIQIESQDFKKIDTIEKIAEYIKQYKNTNDLYKVDE